MQYFETAELCVTYCSFSLTCL